MVMNNARQLSFSRFKDLNLKEFGGALLKKSNPKGRRPLCLKRPIHLVMRSTMATRELSFLRPVRAKRIELILRKQAQRFGVKIYQYANSGNNLHLVVKTHRREAFRAFIRSISGIIARVATGIERGALLGKKFWDARPFTRIIEWGRDYKNACDYVLQNALEALGLIPFRPRKKSTLL